MGVHSMAWEHPIENIQTPQDWPAAGATRYGRGLTMTLTTKRHGWRARLWRSISSNNVEVNVHRNSRSPRRAATAISQLLISPRRCRLGGLYRLL